MQAKTELSLQSDNEASSITNYQPLFTPCYYNGELHVAIRSYDCDGLSYYLLVNPNTLTTQIVLKGDIQHRKPSASLCEIGYYTKEEIEKTPYGLALKHIMQSSHHITNDGITHSMCEHEPNQVFLTIDLCPSNKLFEKDFFEKLVSIGVSLGKPTPIAICITEFWRTTHKKEFEWLLEQQKAETLQITWVNHGATHVYYHDYASSELLKYNFLLDTRTNLFFEFFEIEKALIMHGQVPSVFFRAPGLVTNEKLMKKLNKCGLITLGADAWLAKGEQPSSGSIVLVHGNSNEPAGIKKIMEIIETDECTFLPLQQAFPAPDKVTDYLASIQLKELDSGEQTDDEAEKQLAEKTRECISSGPSFWKKPPHSSPGTRVAKDFKDSQQRLILFRELKDSKYAITQHRDPYNPQSVSLKVQLPTIQSVAVEMPVT
ncbi:TPA: hypothetical protein ACJ6J3_09630 [Legionella pneumophila]|uniref:hypothetical protein n=1 Tax=Legionella pneumophila TaxID=446 RepID=UPI000776B176|nr:hypothetical protein [Legionella pneumophila]